jgi:hypothetical protein
VSRTIRTGRVRLFVDERKNFLLIGSSVPIFDLANGEVENATANRFIDETGQVTFLAAGAGEVAPHGAVCFIRDYEVPSGHDHNSFVFKHLYT